MVTMVSPGILTKANLGLHIAQALWSLVVMGVVISSMTASGPASGATKYMFAMCWFAIPALIYLTQAPRFERTKMFAHPYWVAGVNSIFSLLWFAAFVAVADYTNKGINDGEGKEKDEKIKAEGGCAVFPAGTGEGVKACKMNRAAVGLGVVLWFLWLGTTAIGGYAAWYFREHSVSPFEDLTPSKHDIEQTTKDAFNPNDEYALINKDREIDREDEDDRFSHHHGRSDSVTSYDGGQNAHPGNPVPWGGDGSAYNGIGGHGPVSGGRRTTSGLDMPIAPDEDDYTYRGGAALR